MLLLFENIKKRFAIAAMLRFLPPYCFAAYVLELEEIHESEQTPIKWIRPNHFGQKRLRPFPIAFSLLSNAEREPQSTYRNL